MTLEAGHGDALILLHGFALDERLWRRQVETLSADYRVVAPTLPDFGARPVRTSGTSARAVVELMDALRIESAHVAGLSLGGAIAVDLTLAFPERVRSLVLVDALLLGRPTGLREYAAAAALAKAGRLEEARQAWLGGALAATAKSRTEFTAMTADYDGGHWLGTAETGFEIAQPEPRLGEIRKPTLVIVGELDTPAFRAMSDAYAALIPNAQKAVLPGCGHLANLDAPAAFESALHAFLAS